MQKKIEISTLDLSYVVPVKYTMEILQNFVAFSEYMNFNIYTLSFNDLEGTQSHRFLDRNWKFRP